MLLAGLLCGGTPLAAQDALEGQAGTPPERIDLLAEARAAASPEAENCSPDQDGIETEGPIIVCRRKDDPRDHGYDREAAQRRYAERTMNAGDPRAPDVSGPGIFKGPATIGGLCIPGLAKCPPPPAYMVDFSTIPEAPPGSDADRIARGLAPRGIEEAVPAEAGGLSPAGSASPAGEP